MGDKTNTAFLYFVLAVLIFSGLLPFSAKGQAEVLYFHRLSTDDGLTSQRDNYYIFQDSTGFVWISSIVGLNRFDGRAIQPYHHDNADTCSLADDNIQSPFFEDADGVLWFATHTALHHYDRQLDCFHRHRLRVDGLEADRNYRLFFLDPLAKKLWVGVGNKLFLFPADGKGDTTLLGDFPLNYNTRVMAGDEDEERYLLIPDTSGFRVIRFPGNQPVQQQSIRLDRWIPGFRVLSYYYEDESCLWVGGNRGLLQVNLQSGAVRVCSTVFGSEPITGITGIAPASKARLVIGTQKMGLYFIDSETFRVTHRLFRDENGLTAPFRLPVDKLTVDRDHNLWVSTVGQGVFYTNLKKKKFNTFLQSETGEPTAMSFVKALSEDPQGRLLCLTKDGIVVLDGNGNRLPGFPYLKSDNVPFAADELFFLRIDRAGNVWVTSHRGLYVLPAGGRTFEAVPVSVPLKKQGFLSILEQSSGRLLVSSGTDGIFEVKKEKERFHLAPVTELSSFVAVSVMQEDTVGKRLLLCQYQTGIAVFRQQGQTLRFDSLATFKPLIQSVLNDTDGAHYWLATDQGLYRATLSEEGLHYSQEAAYPRQALNGLLRDKQGRLWASTDRGLLRFDPKSGNTRLFRVSEGLQASEFNFWAFLETRDGRFAFAGVNGINLFDPLNIKDLAIPARPVITRIRVNDTDFPGLICEETGATNVSQIRELRLKYRQRTLSFYFAPREYSDPAACRMTYQMIGLDPRPVVSGPDRSARYANLKPGQYTFEVGAANSDGVPSDDPIRLAITIIPPFWQQLWFKLLGAIGIILLTLYWIRNHIRKIRREAEELRKEAEAKRREAEFQQKEAEFRQKEAELKQLAAETETAVLRLQMNPHFIFNSLNSISSYLLQRDVDTANDYLLRFSTLMRQILKYSEKPFIAVSTELELLKQYLRTEAMRLENRFDFQIDMDESLDPDELIVPPMILQPFLENAVWHGLSEKKKDGRIQISFRREEGEMLCCTIEDNGIGRPAARRKVSAQEHESKALAITERRLQLLQEQHGRPASCDIIDLSDKAGQPAGTG